MKPNWKRVAVTSASSAAILASLLLYFEPAPNPGIPYQDVTRVWTNCLGNTHDVDPKLFYTKEQCKVIDGENQVGDLEAVDRYVRVPINKNERAAYASFIHNVGSANFHHSSLLRWLNKGEHIRACKGLLAWVYAGHKKLAGLVARRQAEYEICITPN